jgi:hypothetical protein
MMDGKVAIVGALMVISILVIWFAILRWMFSIFDTLGLPVEAYWIVGGLLTLVFTVLGARLFLKE